MKHIRLAALLLALCLVCLFAAGCGVRPIKSTKEEMTVVGYVGEDEVYYEELRYLTLKFRDAMAATYGEDIWTDPAKAAQYLPELKANVWGALPNNYAVLALCREVLIDPAAKEIADAVQKDVEDVVEEFGGKKAYREGLADEYLTDHFFRFTLTVNYLESELLYVYTDDLGLIADDESEIYDIIMGNDFARTLHIYIANDPGENIDDNRAKAEKALSEYQNGIAFNTLIGRYSEDFHMTTTSGYYFTRGEMKKAYEDAAFALSENEVSDIVETDDGFYIIIRLPKDAQYVMSHLSELIAQYQYAELYNMIDEKKATLSFVPNEYADSLDLLAMQ